MNAWPNAAGRPVTKITGIPASPSRSSAAYVEASTWPPVVMVPSTSENSARTGPRSSSRGRVMGRAIARLRRKPDSGDERQRRVDAANDRAIALPRQPVLEIDRVEANDAADLEHRQRIMTAAGHVSAPALRAAERASDALPGFDVGGGHGCCLLQVHGGCRRLPEFPLCRRCAGCWQWSNLSITS